MKNLAYIIFIFFIFYISGCGKNDERDYEDSRNNTKTNSSDTETTKNNFNSTHSLPSDFPSDIPIYVNSKILSSSSGNNPMVTLETDDNLNDVTDFYKTEMIKNGYNTDSFNDLIPGSNMMIFSKEGKQYTISCMYNTAKAKTLITMQTRGTGNQKKDTVK